MTVKNIARPKAPAPAPPPDPALVMNQLAAEATALYDAFRLRRVPDPLAAALAAHLVVEPMRRGKGPLLKVVPATKESDPALRP